ncbi:tRNA synthetases class I (M)-domain-containing protein [Syncephalastrum racemosum]|uniref:Probable methionine--tRNA ligase, mitochondrial n=1 Tax=Syncephalastrum racemosum TaxID=13706 RepID=A0A1X2HC56_SYNRA|nr:tRNA synthetases class I (M)-domain-containing protein [Syncephalastrum racemosum]
MSPIDFCDKVSDSFKRLCDTADISYTTFMRTTEPRHAKAVSELWKTLEKKGYLYKGKHEGWYAVSDEAFYTDSQVTKVKDESTGRQLTIANESGQVVEWTVEENYKFKLSAFQDRLLQWIDDNPKAIVPENRRNEVVSWIKQGLGDLSVSRLRSRLDWGIQVPGDADHTIYVWLDALTNYMTAAGYPWRSKEDMDKSYWPANVHIVGKDIIRFHAIYWPAFLMAAGLPLPKQILAHAHWTMGKMKMSKSRGNVADPFELMDTYGPDAVRYYLVRDGGLADDADYSEEMIMRRYRKELAGQLGNLVMRSTSSTLNPAAVAPGKPAGTINPADQSLHEKLVQLPSIFEDAFENREFNRALTSITDMLAEANKHFSDNAPWELVSKGESEQQRLDTVLYYAIESCRIAGTLLQPVMPNKMNALLNRLGAPADKRTLEHTRLWETARPLGEDSAALFPKIKKSA